MNSSSLDTTLQKALETTSKHHLFTDKCALLLMVSGGSDSTALTYIIKQMQKQNIISNIAALHVNHMIRNNEAKQDQLFVRELCGFLDIPLFEVEINIPKIAKDRSENIEACARNQRYSSAQEALLSLCQHTNTTIENGRIVTAHTLDDRIENFFMRTIVGTGPGGFRAMKHKSNNVVRPLLDITKNNLTEAICELATQKLAYANSDGKLWCEDSTNDDQKCLRAYVRHSIIPSIRKINSNYQQTLKKTMDLIADEDDMLNESAKKLLSKTCSLDKHSKTAEINNEFAKEKVPIKRRAIYLLLKEILPRDTRIENASVTAIMLPFARGVCKHEKTKNIQNDLIVSSNKFRVKIETSSSYRKRTKKI